MTAEGRRLLDRGRTTRELDYLEVGGRVVARWWRENDSGSYLPDVWHEDAA
jgi:hypothetical protein